MANVQEKCLSLLGIKAFHDAGYTGSRVKIMSDEKVYEKDFPNVISPKGFQKSSGSWHGTSVMRYLHMVAPNATYIAYPLSGSSILGVYKSPAIDYIKSEKVHVFTTSQTGQVNTAKQKAMQECIDTIGTVFCAAAGNEGKKGLRPESTMITYLAIGGVDYEKAKDISKFKRVDYSSCGKELDYVTIAEMPTNPELDSGALGTSFCAPVFAAMVGLVQDFFIDKTGKPLTYAKMIEFINDNCVDLQDQGFDIYTGHGLFVLPEPASIDIKKYCPDYIGDTQEPKEDKVEVEIQETQKTEEKKEEVKQEPVKEDKKEETKKIIELIINNKKIYINGEAKDMDVAPIIKNSRTYVPVRFVSEALGCEVQWDAKTQKVTIRQ